MMMEIVEVDEIVVEGSSGVEPPSPTLTKGAVGGRRGLSRSR